MSTLWFVDMIRDLWFLDKYQHPTANWFADIDNCEWLCNGDFQKFNYLVLW